jgi:UDPglucose--hexose-1-phosphate uridylyltransferase
MPELRKDPIIGRWVIIATERAKRPSAFATANLKFEDKEECPFCPGNEIHTPNEILAYREVGAAPNSPGWWIRVIPNDHPVLNAFATLDRAGDGVYDFATGVGHHEVIIETPEHNLTFGQIPQRQIEEILWSYRDRFLGLKKDRKVKHVLIFRNYGHGTGGLNRHPHSELIGLPIVPKTILEEIRGSRNYFKYKERCVYCDIIREEQRVHERLIQRTQHFISIAPFASRFPFETWILPTRHNSSFEDIEQEEIKELAKVFRDTMIKIEKVLNNPPCTFILHSSPFAQRNIPEYHWHIEIMPIVVHIAGFEWGSGFYINPMPPEKAVKEMQKV